MLGGRTGGPCTSDFIQHAARTRLLPAFDAEGTASIACPRYFLSLSGWQCRTRSARIRTMSRWRGQIECVKHWRRGPWTDFGVGRSLRSEDRILGRIVTLFDGRRLIKSGLPYSHLITTTWRGGGRLQGSRLQTWLTGFKGTLLVDTTPYSCRQLILPTTIRADSYSCMHYSCKIRAGGSRSTYSSI